MKAAQLGVLVGGALLTGGLWLYLRAPASRDASGSSVSVATSAAGAPSEPSLEKLVSGDTGSTRTAAGEPAPGPVAASAPPAELQAPATQEDPSAAPDPSEDSSLLGDGTKVLPTPISVDEVRRQYADLEVRYGKMTTSELRQSFDALQRLVEQSSDENGKQLSIAQLEAIRRDMTFIKERLYP